MRRKALATAKSAAGLAAGFGAVIFVTAVLVGVLLTSGEIDDGIDSD